MVTFVTVGAGIPSLAKVLPPQGGAPLLRRDRLSRALQRAVERHRVVTITAPTGYGKTALAGQFCQELAAPVCWYTMGPEDDSPRTFLLYLIAALRSRFPKCGRRTEHLLNTSGELEASLGTIVGTLVAEVLEGAPEWFVLVLDDLHHAQRSDTRETVDLLLRRLPANCFVLLTSRNRPPFKALARLAAERQITRLGAGDLQFSADEVVALLGTEGFSETAVPRAEVDALVRRTQGWITGIILTSRWFGGGGGGRAAPVDAEEDLDDFLSTEVMDRMPAAWRHFLLQTAVLEDVPVDLCREAFGVADAEVLLREMVQAGLLLWPLSGGESYRYHDLFRGFLLRDGAHQGELLRESRRAAAAYHERHGAWIDAIRLYLEGDDGAAAIRVLERCVPDLYWQGRWAVLAELIDRVCSRCPEAPPAVLAYRGRCAFQLGDQEGALRLAHQVEAALQGADSPRVRALLEITRAGALRGRGETVAAREAARRALAVLKKAPVNPETRLLSGEAHHYVGLSYFTAGQWSEAQLPLEQALALYRQEASPYHEAMAHLNLCTVFHRTGQVGVAVIHAEQAISGFRALSNTGAMASALNNLGNLYLNTGAYDLADATLQSALESAREAGILRVQAYATQTLGDVRLHTERYLEAVNDYEQALALAEAAGERALVTRTHLALARAHAALHDPAAVTRDLERAAALGALDRPYDRGLHRFAQALNAYHAGDAAAALLHLDAAAAHFDAAGDERWGQRSRLLLAQAQFLTGGAAAASASLEAVRPAVAQYPAAFSHDARLAQDVLRAAVAHGEGGGVFASLLLGSHEARATPPAQPRAGCDRERPTVRAYALGKAEVEMDGRCTPGMTPRARELLFYLLTQGKPVRRETLLDALWGESDSLQGSSVLRTNVYRLRRALYDAAVVTTGDAYALDPDGNFWLDAHHFQECAREALRPGAAPGERLMALESAAQLYQGSFLPDCYSEWSVSRRHELEAAFGVVMRTLAKTYLDEGLPARAAAVCDRLLALDPCDEAVALLKVRALWQARDLFGASQAWRQFGERLEAESGEQPSREAQRTAAQLLAAAPV